MSQPPLTRRLSAKLAELFSPEDRSFAEQWLLFECGPQIAGGYADARWVERVRAAVLKLSGGSLERLADATCLGQRDWRDLLTGSGFGESLDSYVAWLNQRTSN
jgi:hypothetical protein